MDVRFTDKIALVLGAGSVGPGYGNGARRGGVAVDLASARRHCAE